MFFYLSKIFTFLIDPLFLILSVCLFALIRANRNRVVILSLFIGLFCLSTPFTSNRLMGVLEGLVKPTGKLTRYDAVVVLSGMVDLRLSSASAIEFSDSVDRILRGVELVKNGTASYLILSGGDGALLQRDRSESRLLKEFAKKWGVDKKRIIVDASSRNTFENALVVAKIRTDFGLKRLLLITSAFHMFRSRGCFREMGVEVDVLPVDFRASREISDFRDFLPSSGALYQTSVFLHELAGIVVYGFTHRARYPDGITDRVLAGLLGNDNR